MTTSRKISQMIQNISYVIFSRKRMPKAAAQNKEKKKSEKKMPQATVVSDESDEELESEVNNCQPESEVNPLTPQSDWNLISPYYITPESNTKVRRIRELITN